MAMLEVCTTCESTRIENVFNARMCIDFWSACIDATPLALSSRMLQ